MSVLVLVEHDGNGIKDATLATVTAAAQLGEVHALVAGCYRHDAALGLFADTLATTGARPIQAARLTVEDLHDHPVKPKLMMPKTAKGGGRKSYSGTTAKVLEKQSDGTRKARMHIWNMDPES